MEIPKTIYHGTFWPEGVEPDSGKLSADVGYISTSTTHDWAWFFAFNRRYFNKKRAGRLMVYEINTGLLPEDVLRGCIPPDGMDPRASTQDWLKKSEEDMKPERIKINEWRFPYIPLSAVVSRFERSVEANPTMTPWDVAIVHPRD